MSRKTEEGDLVSVHDEDLVSVHDGDFIAVYDVATARDYANLGRLFIFTLAIPYALYVILKLIIEVINLINNNIPY